MFTDRGVNIENRMADKLFWLMQLPRTKQRQRMIDGYVRFGILAKLSAGEDNGQATNQVSK